MKTIVTSAAAALLAASFTTGAVAQTNPYAKRAPYSVESYGSFQQPAGDVSRRAYPYSVPDRYQGTIHWNTPNADGNFGGPGAGGSGGNFGG